MSTAEIKKMHEQYVMPTYAPGLALVKGVGSKVWDADGNEFLDFTAGIAVTNIGHAHPTYLAAIREQSEKVVHVSNLFFNEKQPQLAKALVERADLGGGKVFFCNSGAEANEGLIKLARYWGQDSGRYEIVTMRKSFHGRTLATLTATGQEKVQKGFAPLASGFVYADFNDIDSVKAVCTDKTVAVMLEAIQGESGVNPADADFMVELRAFCDEKGLLLLMDEVQCGMGRTGNWFAYQNYQAKPDAFSLAKGLGNGYPIGAVVASPKLQDVFKPGAHATTFGGTPLACAAALAVLEVIDKEELLKNSMMMGAYLAQGLCEIASINRKWISSVRGLGLMVGLVLDVPALPLQQKLQEKGFLCIATAGNVLRLVPPLNVSQDEVAQALKLIGEACSDIYDQMAALSPMPCQCPREG